MTRTRTNERLILAVAPSTRGFGYAVFEGNSLLDWGVKQVKKDRNAGCVAKVQDLLEQYHPRKVVLEDFSAKTSRRALRIRELGEKLAELAPKHGAKVLSFPIEKVKRSFFPDGDGTKHRVAEVIASRFPNELGFRLPPKRKPWMSEDYRMDIFDAVALGMKAARMIGGT